jgi:acetolactate synthase I/II/III large subunit
LHDALRDDTICVDDVGAQIPQTIQLLHECKAFSQYRGALQDFRTAGAEIR